MSKRIVDLTVVEVPTEQIEGEKITNKIKHDPVIDNQYYGKKSGKPLKCDCGQPRKRGTMLCDRCKLERKQESEARHKYYERKSN